VYSRNVNGRELTFGVSGLLYKRNVLMYDRQTESLWSQVRNEAVTGPMTGAKLQILPSSLTTWERWQRRHPETMVLSLNTGHERDYSRDPYADYYEERRGFFGFFRGLFARDEGREMVAGIELDGRTKAYPLETLRQQGETTDTFAGRTLTFTFEPVTGDLNVKDAEGNRIPYISAYRFVWEGIHPDTEVFGE
jgi:hypothetical protein